MNVPLAAATVDARAARIKQTEFNSTPSSHLSSGPNALCSADRCAICARRTRQRSSAAAPREHRSDKGGGKTIAQPKATSGWSGADETRARSAKAVERRSVRSVATRA